MAGYLISPIRAFPLVLPILISSLLIQTDFSQDFDLYHICSNCSQNYTKGSTYDTNLNNLLTDLQNKTPPNNGFLTSSSGHGSDRVYGLALCRGDVSRHDCGVCLSNAKGHITEYCPNSRAAINWHDFCFLKYSTNDFFRQIDTENKFHLRNLKNAGKPVEFYAKAIELLSNLSKKASDDEDMFAGGEKVFDKKIKIYGLAQCSRDISKGNCMSCLECAVKELPGITIINGTVKTIPVGGRTLTGSCYVGYEIYPFLHKY